MKVLSLFDGISCARVALEKAGFVIKKYYASEIDKYCINVSKKNYSDIEHIGDVKNINGVQFNNIDLLIGGSPCQDLSIAKRDRKGLTGDRSKLFWEYVRILKEVKPKYFIFENVNSMSKEVKKIITETLQVKPIMINAALVSAQNRKRLFWTNIPNVNQPIDRGIMLKDIIEAEVEEKFNVNISEKYKLKGLCSLNNKSKAITASCYKGYGNDGVTTIRVGEINQGGQGDRIYSTEGKSVCLSANGGGRGAKTGLYEVPFSLTEARTEEAKFIRRENLKNGRDYSPRRGKVLVPRRDGKSNCITSGRSKESLVVGVESIIRKLTPIECERLQGLNDNYTSGISNTQRYKCLGNAFNVDVITHILLFIKK